MKLIFLSGPLEGSRYQVDDEVTIGRDESNGVVIPDSSVSLVHCQIRREASGVVLRDLGSTNGISVNGNRIISAVLHDGDGIAVAGNRVRVELPDEQADEGSGLTHVARDDGFADTEVTRGAQESTILISEPSPTESRRPAELSGNIFGNVTYFLKRKIADGGMGAVYEADQFGAEGFIKKVAIKTILPKYVKKTMFVESFIGEAKLVANLVHQNIVQIHHLGRHEEGYYIAMEYIDGINLTNFMMRHRRLRKSIPVDIASFIVSRITRGLEYAHSKVSEKGHPLNLVHRDVSPNNIMITCEGEVKLTDFGVAKAAQFMEDDDEYLVGSVEYMSPEQADCKPVDGRSDLFSLGLVYYELLTGVRIFQCRDDDIDATVKKVIDCVIPDPLQSRSDLPPSVVKILMKCLQKNADDRYAVAGDLGYLLEREMYSQGYGPTILRLASYIEELAELEKSG